MRQGTKARGNKKQEKREHNEGKDERPGKHQQAKNKAYSFFPALLEIMM